MREHNGAANHTSAPSVTVDSAETAPPMAQDDATASPRAWRSSPPRSAPCCCDRDRGRSAIDENNNRGDHHGAGAEFRHRGRGRGGRRPDRRARTAPSPPQHGLRRASAGVIADFDDAYAALMEEAGRVGKPRFGRQWGSPTGPHPRAGGALLRRFPARHRARRGGARRLPAASELSYS